MEFLKIFNPEEGEKRSKWKQRTEETCKAEVAR